MNLRISDIFKVVRHLHDPLFKNSLFIMLTSASGAGFGFIFWVLAAKLYSAEDVGVATALISSMALIVLLSKLGLDFSIIRFFPTNDNGGKSSIFSTAVVINIIFAVLLGVIFIAGVDMFSPELHVLALPTNAAFYLLFLAAGSGTALGCTSFVAVRKAFFQFIQSVVVGSRVLFLIPLVMFGSVGIFWAVGVSFLFALVTAYILLLRSGINFRFLIDRDFLNESFHFSAGNYLAGLFMAGPTLILPIMVLNLLGAEQAAYYFIAYAIAALLFKIPHAVSMSLFVEGSHGEDLKRTVLKSLFAVFSLLVPSALILYVCSGWVLGLVGADYATGGQDVLQIMVAASLFVGINSIYFAIKRVQKDVRGLVVLSGVVGGLLVGFGYVFADMFGLVGLGYAWLVSNGVGSVMVATMVWREKWV